MKIFLRLTLAIFIQLPFLVFANQDIKNEKEIVLVTMDIPPFMSPTLPEGGAAVYALKEMFKSIGYSLEVRFVPIQRTRHLGMSDPNVVGFFPSFKDDDFLKGFKLSNSIYETPWVIAERKDTPIHWNSAKDLKKYKCGNVSGYTLRSEVRDFYTAHPEKIDPSPADLQNVIKLAMKRVDCIFIDKHVFEFLVSTAPILGPYRENLQINSKIVQLGHYGIAFKTDPAYRAVREQFNTLADKKIFIPLVEEYLRKYLNPKKS